MYKGGMVMKDIENILDLYTDYLITSNTLRTENGLSDLTYNFISHDKISKFLLNYDSNSKELWLKVKGVVRESENNSGLLIFDDSIERKPYTDENEIVCWHYDHTTGKMVKGINIITALVKYDDISLPVNYQIVNKTVKYIDKKTNKEKRKSETTKNQRFIEMFDQCKKNNIKFKYVLADSWYASRSSMKHIHKGHKKFIFGFKSTNNIAFREQDKWKHHYIQIGKADLEENKMYTVYLEGLYFAVNVAKKTFINKDGSEGVLYLVTNDISLIYNDVFNIYHERWSTEEFYKSLKVNIGIEKSPTKTVKSQSNHIFSSLISFIKLECIKIASNLNHFAIKSKLIFVSNLVAMKELIEFRPCYNMVLKG